MEENKSLSFDQLPSAVGELLTKVNTMMTRLDDIGQRIGNAPSENDHVLMDIREASAFVRKKVSSLYAYTSERRNSFLQRGNTLYFFKDQLIKWIEAGGSWDKPYESTLVQGSFNTTSISFSHPNTASSKVMRTALRMFIPFIGP